jgi:hypothetical protein
MHPRACLGLDPNLDTGHLGKVIEGLRGPALGILNAIEIDPHLCATIRRPCERLHNWPVSQDISRKVDFVAWRYRLARRRRAHGFPPGHSGLLAPDRRCLGRTEREAPELLPNAGIGSP